MGCTDPPHVDQTIRQLLQGKSCEVEEGSRLLIRRYQRPLIRWAAKRFPSLRFQAEDIWQETMLAVLNMAESQRLSSDGRLRPLLKTIANRRAVDLLRSELKLATIEDPSQLVDWRSEWNQRDIDEIMELIVFEIMRWKRNRRLVWEVNLKYFGELQSFTELRDAVFCETGKWLSVRTVIRKIREGRQRIREVLSRLD